MRWWIPCLAVWFVVGWLVLSPAGTSAGGLPIPDKLAHLVAWLGLALAAWPAVAVTVRWSRASRAAAVLGACASYAVATELLQGLVPGRSAEALDAVADLAGAALGVLTWWLIEARRRRGEVPRPAP
ncbi:MAG: VanZ family protein [Deltaproteobacteria bacterium HGW-Deltaproteobacteria-14]|jgi:VanZ family protein|nr:MAG: VanZ family protein [Deltaproteobacteria bacterium HGW-Deltaproteobacteria-14]